MWWMAAYGALIIGRYAIGVAAVRGQESIPSMYLIPSYQTDVTFYP
jgi:hypothetical protein